jgi:enoyl-CoA hydratase/carnithine racemase
VTFCPAIFGRYIPSFDIADLLQPMVKIDCLVRSAVGRSTVEESNQRRCRLLRLRPKWPRYHRTTEQRDELAPLAVQAAKRMMRMGLNETFPDHVHHVYLQLLPLFKTQDMQEGIKAFMEKREPKFEGR